MSIIVNLTEEEILDTPNDYDLGEKIRIKYWEQKDLEIEEQRLKEMDGESYILIPDNNGMVIGIYPPNDKYTENGYDKCIICGKVSPYMTSTHIDLRIGYVEGTGQECFKPSICKIQ
jgi:hypothetical protein